MLDTRFFQSQRMASSSLDPRNRILSPLPREEKEDQGAGGTKVIPPSPSPSRWPRHHRPSRRSGTGPIVISRGTRTEALFGWGSRWVRERVRSPCGLASQPRSTVAAAGPTPVASGVGRLRRPLGAAISGRQSGVSSLGGHRRFVHIPTPSRGVVPVSKVREELWVGS